MAKPPPSDPWEDLLSQLDASLDELDFPDGPTRDAVLEGVRDALESLTGGQVGPPPGPPKVEVVEGGRDASSPRVEGERPALRVAREPTEGRSSGVTVLRLDPRAVALADEGRILLRDAASTQRVYFGPEHPQTYRILCDSGSFTVLVDGEDPFDLEEGQSVDVDGGVISVTRPEPEPSEGRYVRIGGS